MNASSSPKPSSDAKAESSAKAAAPADPSPAKEPAGKPDTAAAKPAKPAEPSKPSEPAKPAKPSGQPSRRRKWAWRIVLALVAIVVVFRISLIWLVPWLVDRAVRPYGLSATVDRIDLNIMGTEAGVWQLELRPEEGGEPFGSIAYMRADLNTLALITGELHILRAEAEGVDLHIQRQSDGRLPLLDRILASLPESQDKKDDPFTFTPPVRIDALRLNQINVVFTDAAVLPRIETDIRLNFALSYLDAPSQPADFMLDLRARSLVEYLLIDGQFTTQPQNLQGHLNIDMQGLSPRAIAGYLAAIGLTPDANRLDAKLQGKIDLNLVQAQPTTQPTIQPGMQPGMQPGTQPATGPAATQPASAAQKLAQGTTALQGQIELSNIRLEADRQPAARLDRLHIDLAALTDRLLNSAQIQLQGVYAKASRDEQGKLGFAGMKLGAPDAKSPSTTQPAQAAADAQTDEQTDEQTDAQSDAQAKSTTTRPASQGDQFSWRLGTLDLKDVELAFEDAAVTPAVTLGLNIDTLTLEHEGGEAIGPTSSVRIRGRGSLPGIAEALSIDGRMHPFQTPIDLNTQLSLAGLDLQTLAPYLAKAGLAPEIEDGSLAMQLQAAWTPRRDGSIMGSLTLRDMMLQTQGRQQPLGAIGLLQVDELLIDPAAPRLAVQNISLSKTTGQLVRHESGSLAMLGLRTIAMPPDATTSQPASQPATQPTTQPAFEPLAFLKLLPAIDIGRFEWNDIDLRFEDRLASPATSSHLHNAGIALQSFHFSPQTAWRDAKTGSYQLQLGWQQGQGQLQLAGDLQLGHDGGKVSFDLKSHGLDSQRLLPASFNAPVMPSITQGSVELQGHLQAQATDEHPWQLSMHLDRLRVAENDEPVLSVGSMDVVDLSFAADRFAATQVKIDQPRLTVRTLADGSIKLPGVLYRPDVSADADAASPSEPQPFWNALPSRFNFTLALQEASVAGAAITWHDQRPGASSSPAKLTLQADASLEQWLLTPEKAQGRFSTTLQAGELLEELAVRGQFEMIENMPAVIADLQGRGMNLQRMTALLPLPVEAPWSAASLKMTAHARLGRHEEGGLRLRAGIDEMTFSDTAAQEPLIAFDQSLLDVTRFDPAANLIDIRQASLEGLTSRVERTADGRIIVAGMVVSGSQSAVQDAAETAPAASAEEDTPAQSTTQPATPQPASPATNGGSQQVDLGQLLARRAVALPLIQIEALKLGATRLVVTDHQRQAAPLALENLELTNLQPLSFFGVGPRRQVPARLQLTVSPAPIASELTLRMLVRPFDENVLLGMAVEAQGIDGQGLLRVIPELQPYLDGQPLTQGHFETRLLVTGRVHKPSPWSIDFARGGRFNLYVGKTELRQSPDGLVLAGVEELQAQPIEISSQWQEIQLRQVHVMQLAANVWRDETGTHVLGMRLKMPDVDVQPVTSTTASTSASTSAPTTATATDSASPAADTQASASTQPGRAPARSAANEQTGSGVHIRIGRLTVAGLDAAFEDRTHKPVTVVPLTGLDIEARNVSNQLHLLRRPMRFNVLVTAGKVDVPVRQQGGGLLGAIGDTANLLRGRGAGGGEPQMAQRDFFSLITITGQIQGQSQQQAEEGWVKLNVQGLELWALRGLAADAGITIDSGVLDISTDARLEADGEIDTRSRIILGDLSISEPADGPIARHLALPAPLDTVIMAVKSPNGTITLPINVTLRQGRVSTDQIITQTLSATANVIASAFASSPLKLAQGVTGFVGLGGLTELAGLGSAKPATLEPVTIRFSPGDTTLSPRGREKLDEVINQLRKDDKLSIIVRSYLTQADVAVAHQRANPSEREVMQLMRELDARLATLTQTRAQTAGALRAAIAAGASADVASGTAMLRKLDRQIGRLHNSLADLHDLLRPGAQRLASRRARDAAVAISDQRMQWLSQQIEQSEVKNIRQRVQLTPATYNPATAADPATTQPATQPATQPTTQPATQAGQQGSASAPSDAASAQPVEQGGIVITFVRSQ